MPDRSSSPDPGSAERPGRSRALALASWAALLALAAVLASEPLSHDDIFLHLETGRWMLAHREVPRADPFSFTRPGQRWVTHEWGFALLAHGVHAAGGMAGLIALRVALVLALAGVLLGTARGFAQDPLGFAMAAGAGCVALWALRGELILRAALPGLLFFALALAFLLGYEATRRWQRLALLAPLFLPWGNLHSGVVFGLALIACFALAAGLRRERRLAAHYLAAGLGCLAVALCNPNGVETLLYPWRLYSLLYRSGIQWDLGHFARSPEGISNPAFLLLAVLVVAAVIVSRTRRGAGVPLALPVAAVAFLAGALITPRLLGELAVVAVPLVAGALTLPAAPRGRQEAWAALVAVALALAALTAMRQRTPGVLAPHVPRAAVDFLDREAIAGRPFHHQNHGGYLLWRRRQPIFWDGRNDVFASLVKEVTTTPFPAIVERYGIDYLLLTEREWRDLEPMLAGPEWQLRYWDDFVAIYTRRREPEANPAQSLRWFAPFGGRPGLAEVAADAASARAAREELEQLVAANPQNQRALYFLGAISLHRGELDRARRELEAARRIRPNAQVEQALAAALAGDRSER